MMFGTQSIISSWQIQQLALTMEGKNELHVGGLAVGECTVSHLINPVDPIS
jgi:hypothetical protein